MGRVYDGIDARLAAWMARQPVFFVSTAPLAADGHVNLSPKGLDGSFVVLDERRVAYLDLVGSGVETIAHLRENGRIVVMFCSFAGPPRIVRLHGRGTAHLAGASRFAELAPLFPAHRGPRSVVEVEVTRVSDSCGYGVPLMTFEGHRDNLAHWVASKDDEELAGYVATRNARSLDGLPGVSA